MARNRSAQSATLERRRARGTPETTRDDDSANADTTPPGLIAYRVHEASQLRLEPAPVERDWLDATADRFGYRCLPVLMANQAGWFIINSHALDAVWDGGSTPDALTVTYREGDPPYPALSHFGHGILTWQIPFLFRTPPGIQLLARGPANTPKDGIYALEGLVETDWSASTFTMNWQVLRPGQIVSFEPGEPICMVVPFAIDLLERTQPEIRRIASEPKLEQDFVAWRQSRSTFLTGLREAAPEAVAQGWQKDYFRGLTQDGTRERSHRTKIRLSPFFDVDGTSDIDVNGISPAPGASRSTDP
jgi:hypothetical protein